MEKNSEFHLYKDINARTGGEIYLGVAGPVRTGKSTMIKRFLEELVLPSMEDSPDKERTRDQIPQSASGRTIMTTEPKFIPKDGAEVVFGENCRAKIRLIDCVGYMADGAVGHEEDGKERMVKTPWFDYEIPFTRAAEIGTRKVIAEHSTIGIAVTADGSFGDIPRDGYRAAEERTVRELKESGKPFLILLNSAHPEAAQTRALAGELQEKYEHPVLTVNCQEMTREDCLNILGQILMEFPVHILSFHIPEWMEILPAEHPLKRETIDRCRKILRQADVMRDIPGISLDVEPGPIEQITRQEMSAADGSVSYQFVMAGHCYYDVLSEYAGIPIADEAGLIHILRELSAHRSEYERVQSAIEEVRGKGYGIVIPDRSEIQLEEPEVVKQGSRFGVRMRALAPSIHMIKADIQTEIAPMVGSEQQAEDLIRYIQDSGSREGGNIWETNIFGKSIGQIVSDGIQAKTGNMSDDCQQKLQHALQKIVNTNSNGLICILL